MTAGHYVIAWLERPHRNLTEAAAWFKQGRAKNYAPWRLWSEHDWNDGGAVNFITAGGMFLQSLIFGYGGMRFHDDGISFDPVLPFGVEAMKLRGLTYAGSELDVSITDAEAQFSIRRGEQDTDTVAALEYQVNSGIYWLKK